MLRRSAPLALVLLPLPAAAQDFSCRNEAAEIRCADGKCEVEAQAFTPMALERHGATLTLCAYSGCWEGRLLVRRTRGDIELLFAELRATGPERRPGGSIAVIHDRRERTAQMRWGGFSNAMACEEE